MAFASDSHIQKAADCELAGSISALSLWHHRNKYAQERGAPPSAPSSYGRGAGDDVQCGRVCPALGKTECVRTHAAR